MKTVIKILNAVTGVLMVIEFLALTATLCFFAMSRFSAGSHSMRYIEAGEGFFMITLILFIPIYLLVRVVLPCIDPEFEDSASD